MCQSLALAAAPGALMCSSGVDTPSAASDHDDECCKGLGPDQVCPMHKHRGHGSKPTSSAQDEGSPQGGGRRLQSSCSPSTLALQALLSELGVFPRISTVSDDLNLRSVTETMLVSVLTHTIAPGLPPPRA